MARGRFVNQRLAPVPMETNAALAVPDPEAGGLTMWVSCQAPHYLRSGLAEPLGDRLLLPWRCGFTRRRDTIRIPPSPECSLRPGHNTVSADRKPSANHPVGRLAEASGRGGE